MKKQKQVIDHQRLELALHAYGKQVRLQGNGHFKLCCPWHEDNDPTCILFVDTGIFYCFSCHADKSKGKRGVPLSNGLVKLGVPDKEINAIIRDAAELELLQAEDFSPAGQLEEEVQEKKLTITDRRGWPPNWSFRGIRPDYLARFDANLTTINQEPLPRLELFLPHRGPGIYLRLSSSVQPKTWNDFGLFTKAAQPFGTLPTDWKLAKDALGIVLVEGAYDALKLSQHIFDHFGSDSRLPVVALLGSPGWPTYFKEKFLTFLLPQFCTKPALKVFLALDPDDAGEKMAERILHDLVLDDWFLQRSQVVRILFPRNITDPGELTFEQFRSVFVPQILKDTK